VSGDRRPEEVAVVVRRPGANGAEFLVLLRSPQKLGYWHLVAGGVEWEETPAAAAAGVSAHSTPPETRCQYPSFCGERRRTRNSAPFSLG